MIISTRVSELELDTTGGQFTQTVTLTYISWPTYQAILTDINFQLLAQ